MKISQSNDQLVIKTSGIGQLVFGVVLIIAGLGLAILLPGTTDSNGQKTPAWVGLIGLVICVFGVAIAFFARNKYITIAKGAGTTIVDKKIIGGGVKEQTVPTANITAVRLSTYLDQSSNTNSGQSTTRRSVLSLLLNNNDLIEVGTSGGKGGFSFNGLNIGSLISKAPLSGEASQISTFLGVPLDAEDSSSISGAIKSVKDAFGQSSQPQQPADFNPNPQAPLTPEQRQTEQLPESPDEQSNPPNYPTLPRQ